jgi:hypothetical protein
MKTKAFARSRDERKRVEMRFAHLKTHHGFERLRLRGLSGARDEFHLAARTSRRSPAVARNSVASTGRESGSQLETMRGDYAIYGPVEAIAGVCFLDPEFELGAGFLVTLVSKALEKTVAEDLRLASLVAAEALGVAGGLR